MLDSKTILYIITNIYTVCILSWFQVSIAPIKLLSKLCRIIFYMFLSVSLTIVNVGLEISSSKLKYDKNPSVNFVFPEPRSPERTMMSPSINAFIQAFFTICFCRIIFLFLPSINRRYSSYDI